MQIVAKISLNPQLLVCGAHGISPMKFSQRAHHLPVNTNKVVFFNLTINRWIPAIFLGYGPNKLYTTRLYGMDDREDVRTVYSM